MSIYKTTTKLLSIGQKYKKTKYVNSLVGRKVGEEIGRTKIVEF